jgi:transcriptional regulator with PAS, ATPase and Fis domain
LNQQMFRASEDFFLSRELNAVDELSDSFIGTSAPFVRLQEEIRAAARTHAKVLILGETGTGKEIVARLIHTHSARRMFPFVAVNCSGIPETLLESELFGHVRGSFTGAYRDKPGVARVADRGTLFLDELGEMSLRMQAVLLRLAETGEIQPIGSDAVAGRTDARIIAATNRDLRAQIEAQQFREDLYYRLNVIQINVPSLRDRGEDIPLLVAHYLDRASRSHRMARPVLSAGAQEILQRHSWPGNIRELKNVAERLVVRDLKRTVEATDLPAEILSVNRPISVAVGAMPAAASDVASASASGSAIDPESTPASRAMWERMRRGENFWGVVHEPFRNHDITRADVQAVIKEGLKETRGSYRALLGMFNLPASDYKRVLSFIHQHDCHVPFQRYRTLPGPRAVEKADIETAERAAV